MRTIETLLVRLGLLAAAVSFLFVVQCGKNVEPSGREAAGKGTGLRNEEKVILTVQGNSYKNADFDRYVTMSLGGLKQNLSAESLSRLFDKFVEEKLLLEAARQRNVALSWEEKKNYLAKIAQESIPAEAGSLAEGRSDEQVFDRLLIEKYTYRLVKDVRVTDDEVHAYYQARKKDFLLAERVRVRQILLDSEEKAVNVWRRLENASRDDFQKIAREVSIGPESLKGGEMGVFRAGELPYEMERVIFSLEPEKLSRVFESSYGYHIFWVDEKYPPELVPEQEAAPSIRLRIIEQKIKEAVASHIEELKERMDWTASPESLPFSYQRIVP